MTSALTLPASVYTKVAAPQMSKRYIHVDSSVVVDAMLNEGFVVAEVNTGVRRGGDPLYSRHTIDFRHPNSPSVGGAVPRVLFGNSHDGSTKAYALAGVFRFVCSNGMVVGTTYAQERVRHIGDAASHLIERMQKLAKNTGPLFKQIETWQRKDLTTAQSREFARLASMLRWGDPHRFDVEDLLEVRRPEDDRGGPLDGLQPRPRVHDARRLQRRLPERPRDPGESAHRPKRLRAVQLRPMDAGLGICGAMTPLRPLMMADFHAPQRGCFPLFFPEL